MLLYVLDTNIVTLLSHGAEPVSSRVRAHPPDEIAIAAITVKEAMSGWYSSIGKAKTPAQIELAYKSLLETVELLARYRLLNFTQPAIIRSEAMLRMKLNVGGDDLRIAAIALEHNAKVVSANVRDFSRVPGLQVEDWTV